MKVLLAAVFAIAVVLYTAVTKLSIGLPLRTLALLFLSATLAFCYFRETREFFQKNVAITAAFIALGITGSILTYINKRFLPDVFEGLTSNIIQPYLILFCSLMLIRLLGLAAVVYMTLIGAALTGGVAILQFLQIGPAWRLREILSEVQNEPATIRAYVANRDRAIGLSVTPIVFSYHMTCTYILLNVLYRFNFMRWMIYYGSVGLLSIATLANGTRSVLLGIAASEVLMELRKGTAKSILTVGIIGLAGVGLYLYAEAVGSRVAETDDASALGRIVLNNFGARLAADNPLGLGWDFDPAGYAWLYWEYLSDFVNADGVFRLGLHNAYLNFFLIYGIAGTLIAAVALLYDPRFVFITALYLSAYELHIFFHNNGMFIGDYFFWFSFAIIMHVFELNGLVFGRSARPAPVPVFALQR